MEISSNEHRSAPRVPLRGVLALFEGEVSMVHFRVVNISRSGTLLSAGERYPVGKHMELFIVTPELDVIEVSGEVVRHDPPQASMGFKFNDFGPDAEQALEELMQQMS